MPDVQTTNAINCVVPIHFGQEFENDFISEVLDCLNYDSIGDYPAITLFFGDYDFQTTNQFLIFPRSHIKSQLRFKQDIRTKTDLICKPHPICCCSENEWSVINKNGHGGVNFFTPSFYGAPLNATQWSLHDMKIDSTLPIISVCVGNPRGEPVLFCSVKLPEGMTVVFRCTNSPISEQQIAEIEEEERQRATRNQRP
eukprot:UN07883